MFCQYCGTQQPEGVAVCSHCGRPLETTPPVYTPYPPQPASYPARPASEDSGSWGWWVLGFFIPLVGLILFAIWQQDKPLSAKRAGWGALIGFIVSVVLSILLFVLFMVLGVMFTSAVFDVFANDVYSDLYGDFSYYGQLFLGSVFHKG